MNEIKSLQNTSMISPGKLKEDEKIEKLNLTTKSEINENSEIGKQTLKDITKLKKEILNMSTVLKVFFPNKIFAKSLSFTPEKEQNKINEICENYKEKSEENLDQKIENINNEKIDKNCENQNLEQNEETPIKIKEKIQNLSENETNPEKMSELPLEEIFKIRSKLLTSVEAANLLVEQKLKTEITNSVFSLILSIK